MQYLVDVSDSFYFFCSGRGKGESKAAEGVDRFFFCIENPREGGGGSPGGGGAEGAGGCLRRTGEFFLGGGLKIFFRGRNVHQEYPCHQNDYMQLFLFSGINFLKITITIASFNP